MVRADDHRRRLPQSPLRQRREHLADPVVDHGQLGAVVGPQLLPLAGAQAPGPHRADVVGRPDQQLALPAGVVTPRPRRRRVERLVRVELVHEEQEGRRPGVRRRRPPAQPVGRRAHHPRPWEVQLLAEERPRAVVGPVERARPTEPVPPEPAAAPRRQRGRADVARVAVGAPRVALVPAHVVPRREVGVVVLTPGLEEVRVIRHQHGGYAGPPQLRRDRLLPHLDGAPRPPQEVERTTQDVVARRHARQRARHMRREADGPLGGEAVEVGRLELGPPVAPEHVAVQAVEQQHDQVGGAAAPARRTGHGGCLVGGTGPGRHGTPW